MMFSRTGQIGVAVGFLIAAASIVAVPAVAAESPAIVAIKAEYKACRAARAGAATVAYAIYPGDDYTKDPRWVRKKPAKATAMETLTAFRRQGRIRIADLERATPSGDWIQSFEYCYRADGTLAFALVVLRTHQGNVRVVDRFYFARDGRQLLRRRAIYDLKTKKRISEKKARGFNDVKPVLPKTTKALIKYASPALGR